MSKPRITWIAGKMHFPPDVDPAFIDWVEPLVAKPRSEKQPSHEQDKVGSIR